MKPRENCPTQCPICFHVQERAGILGGMLTDPHEWRVAKICLGHLKNETLKKHN